MDFAKSSGVHMESPFRRQYSGGRPCVFVLASRHFSIPTIVLLNLQSICKPEFTTISIRPVNMGVYTHVYFRLWNPCYRLTTPRRPLLMFLLTIYFCVLQIGAYSLLSYQCSCRASIACLHKKITF